MNIFRSWSMDSSTQSVTFFSLSILKGTSRLTRLVSLNKTNEYLKTMFMYHLPIVFSDQMNRSGHCHVLFFEIHFIVRLRKSAQLVLKETVQNLDQQLRVDLGRFSDLFDCPLKRLIEKKKNQHFIGWNLNLFDWHRFEWSSFLLWVYIFLLCSASTIHRWSIQLTNVIADLGGELSRSLWTCRTVLLTENKIKNPGRERMH